MSDLQFKILTTDEQIRSHLEEWKTVASNPLAHPEVVLRLCRSDGHIVKPYVPILVDDEGRIACMFASRIERQFIGRDQYLPLPKARVRKLTIPPGGIFGRAAATNVARLLRETMLAVRSEKVDIVELPPIDKGDPLLNALNECNSKAYRKALCTEEEHWRLEIAEDFDRQMLLLGKSTRGTLRHNLNRFNRLYEGRFEIRIFSDMDEVDEALTFCQEIDEHSYHRGLGVNVVNDERTNAVYKGLAAQGNLEICILFIDDTPLAFLNNAVIKGQRIGTQMGFNPTFCKYPLGTILLFETVRRYIETGRNEPFDFGIGKADYKSRLCTNVVISEQRELATRRAMFNPLYLYMVTVFKLGMMTRSLFIKLNLEDSARRWLRNLKKKMAPKKVV
ncbi:MAG TPA: hypothetical protein DCX60_00415 [Phycisphaerales bacterium]|nr:hypothetical protein [Phycisphaerales bacterium]